MTPNFSDLFYILCITLPITVLIIVAMTYGSSRIVFSIIPFIRKIADGFAKFMYFLLLLFGTYLLVAYIILR